MTAPDNTTADTPDSAETAWSEHDSAHFIEVGRIHIPNRDEIQRTILDLIPADRGQPMLAVEMGVGAGWLGAAILEQFPAARIIGLDGSPAMLREAEVHLAPFAGRFELRPFRLEDPSWLAAIPNDVGCFVSSLVIHHLDGEGKRTLYRDLHAHLAPGGAVLIADLVAPRSEWERRYMASQWDAEVKRQSLEMTGSLDTYQQFVDDHSNIYHYPDPMDMPSSVPEHLDWLAEA
ncbi:MAG TPA: class I SAM-dependent methyltransferase, partial [Ktedonobacterales bacterium]|nr:class I SAM-dependent methyltransferase [Ktedonobacterales bacterium]